MPSLLPAAYVAAPISWMRATARARKALYLLFCFALLLASGTAAVRGQSVLDGFDPNVNGTVHVIVVQPDGKTLIGGIFTALSPNGGPSITRNGIARLNPDGTLDTAFNPNASGAVAVLSLALQPDGKILVGGQFTSMGADAHNLARLDGTTGLADSFDPNANEQIRSVAVQADGKILAAGFFTNVGGQTRNRIARFDPITGLLDSFDPNVSDPILTMALQADGKILIAGYFGNIGGQTRQRLARLDPTTGLPDLSSPFETAWIQTIAVPTGRQDPGRRLVHHHRGTVSSTYRPARSCDRRR